MLSYFQFLLLPLDEKVQYLYNKGTLLLSYSVENSAITLYSTGDFFVEMCFDEEKCCPKEVAAFKGVQRLQHHAKFIDLTKLMSA